MKKPEVKLPLLVNAEVMHAQHPDTFGILPRAEREAIAPGDCAKVCAGGERFWVSVREVRPGPVFLGAVDSPVLSRHRTTLAYGDLVLFAPENVYEILTAGEIEVMRRPEAPKPPAA